MKRKKKNHQLDGTLVRVMTRQPYVLTVTNLFHSAVTPNFHYSTDTSFYKRLWSIGHAKCNTIMGRGWIFFCFFWNRFKIQETEMWHKHHNFHACLQVSFLCWHSLDFSIGLKSFLGRVESSHFFRVILRLKCTVYTFPSSSRAPPVALLKAVLSFQLKSQTNFVTSSTEILAVNQAWEGQLYTYKSKSWEPS